MRRAAMCSELRKESVNVIYYMTSITVILVENRFCLKVDKLCCILKGIGKFSFLKIINMWQFLVQKFNLSLSKYHSEVILKYIKFDTRFVVYGSILIFALCGNSTVK